MDCRKTLNCVLTICAVLAASPVAHAQTATSNLAGSWQLDTAKTVKALRDLGGEDVLIGMIDGGLQMTYTFQADRVMNVSVMGQEHGGRWKVVGEQRNKLKIEIRIDDDTWHPVEVEFASPDEMKFHFTKLKQRFVFCREKTADAKPKKP